MKQCRLLVVTALAAPLFVSAVSCAHRSAPSDGGHPKRDLAREGQTGDLAMQSFQLRQKQLAEKKSKAAAAKSKVKH